MPEGALLANVGPWLSQTVRMHAGRPQGAVGPGLGQAPRECYQTSLQTHNK